MIRMGRIAVLLAVVSIPWLNHFGNGFHFDDSHAVVDNPYIRDIRNVPSFFTNPETSTSLPANRSWRPIVTASLAVDYWLARGLKPGFFQASTFVWFLVQVCLVYLLALRLFGGNEPAALCAAMLYGVHPVMAETVNYIVQRGEVYSTLGVTAALVLYIYKPGWRRHGIYLIPFVLAVLSKPPALIFLPILIAYIALFEDRSEFGGLMPAVIVTLSLAVITAAMMPKTFDPGAGDALAYRLTQPLVAARYFTAFFLPFNLSADTDHTRVSGLGGDACLGFLFVAGLITAAVLCRRHKAVAFGLWWFLLALIPTAMMPLAEVENDHRMFFPYVGLVIAITGAAMIWLRLRNVVAVLAIGLFMVGTMQRNRVWHTDESLWHDVTLKSPHNGRGLMNYGLTLMARGDYAGALDYFERARVYAPNYSILEVNMGIVTGAMGRNDEADGHFRRALELAPADAVPHFYYGAYLRRTGRGDMAEQQLRAAAEINPAYQANYR